MKKPSRPSSRPNSGANNRPEVRRGPARTDRRPSARDDAPQRDRFRSDERPVRRARIESTETGDAGTPARGLQRQPPGRGDRFDRGPREDRGDRFDRGPRQDRGDRFERGPREDRGDRFDRGPRQDRGDRFDRGPREDRGDRFELGPRQDRGDRSDRGPREDRGDRFERGPRQDRGDRFDRGPREDRGDRFDRGPREDRGDRFERGHRRPRSEDAPRPSRRPESLPFEEEPASPVERKICGIHACLAVARERPDDIIRGYFTEQTARARFGDVMKLLAATRRAYHIVEEIDLQKITQSTHHEGVCLLVREAPAQSLEDWLASGRLPEGRCCLVALEGVANPHNIGAILRVAANFGADAVVMPDAAQARSAAVARTAEGGAEATPVLEAGHFDRMTELCRKAGFSIVSSSSHQGTDLFKANLPERCVIVLGEETSGLPRKRMADSDLSVRIPGTGKVESLNVSVAAGILLGEYWRRWR